MSDNYEWKTTQLPDEGVYLVEVEVDRENNKYHIAECHPNITVIGGHFTFDMPRVLRWREFSKS